MAQDFEDLRSRLHAQLDSILDDRVLLEREAGITAPPENTLGLLGSLSSLGSLGTSYAHLSTTPVAPKAFALVRRATSLIAEALGVPMRSAALQIPAEGGAGERTALRHWLEAVEPILDTPSPTILGGAPHSYLESHTVWIGLSALDVGEVWPVFEPGKRGNRPANLYSLSNARFAALQWKRRLLAADYSEGDANREISAAFGEQWDTIRKWEQSCRAILGDYYVTILLVRAGSDGMGRPMRTGGIFRGLLNSNPLERLRQDGSQYRKEKRRAAELSPAKQRLAKRSEK